jgi:hypothetical protein
MGVIRQTIEQLEDELGLPIVLLTSQDPVTHAPVSLKLRDLPPIAIVFIVNWINDHIP